jgi:Ca2+:H+ antiporter
LLIPRSIRFQDEVPDDQLHDDPQKDNLELGSLETSSQPDSHANEDDSLLSSNPGDDEEFRRGRPPLKFVPSQKTSSKHSIYQNPPRVRISGSLNPHHRGLSQDSRSESSRRVSFSESATSLPQLLLRRSISSPELTSKDGDLPVVLPSLGRKASAVLLVISSLLVAVCAEFLVNTLDDIVASGPFSQSFIGLIILPFAGNCAELITAITVATKGKFDLAIGVSVGSSIQIALFVTPLVVIAGWFLEKEMTMYFGLFDTVALVATTFLVNFLIVNGRASFLEGGLLCACYVVIGIGSYLFPDSVDQKDGTLLFNHGDPT